jgi:hypothetical protein
LLPQAKLPLTFWSPTSRHPAPLLTDREIEKGNQ